MTAASDWLAAKATYDTAVTSAATAQATLATATTALATAKTAVDALVDANNPLKVYNTSGTTFVSVLYVNGSTFVRSVTM